MRIANFNTGFAYEGYTWPVRRWLFSLEFYKCPPFQVGVFRPCVRWVCTKILDEGEPGKIDGRPMKKLGGWGQWTFPWGIVFRIERY